MQFDRISSETERLISDVWAITRSFVGRILQGDQRVSLLAEIAAAGEPAAIAPLFGMLFDRSAGVAEAASECLHRLAIAVPPEDVPELADWYTRADWWNYYERWRQLRVADVARLPKTGSSRAGVLGLVSFHRDGYVREAAVRELAKIGNGFELPFLLLRVNDWVPQVRAEAQAAVALRMREDNLPAFVRNLPLLVRLAGSTRASKAGVFEWLVDHLVRLEHFGSLKNLIQESARPVSRKCFRQAIQITGSHQVELVWLGLRSNDIALRLLAARAAPNVLAPTDLDAALETMEHDGFMPIRREALLARIADEGEAATAPLEAALMDRNASLRELARFHLARRGRNDFAARYRLALSADGSKSIALAGLAETGSESDLELVRPYLTSRFPNERFAAVRALVRLGGAKAAGELAEFLAGDHAKITAAARQGLEAAEATYDAERMEALLDDSRPHVRRAAVHLGKELGGWAGLPLLLRAAFDGDAEVAAMARSRVRKFGVRVFTQPSEHERARIIAAVAATKPGIEDDFVTELNLFLRSRGLA
ncbi:MAG TPA: hypothetical protein VMF30_10990 [Pirellulales bacterium]|nr:hypothetical protein [Pirellulales bacterium]